MVSMLSLICFPVSVQCSSGLLSFSFQFFIFMPRMEHFMIKNRGNLAEWCSETLVEVVWHVNKSDSVKAHLQLVAHLNHTLITKISYLELSTPTSQKRKSACKVQLMYTWETTKTAVISCTTKKFETEFKENVEVSNKIALSAP